MNGLARGDERPESEVYKYGWHIRHVDQAIEKCPAIDRDIVLYRGDEWVQDQLHKIDVDKGGVLIENGQFLSMSADPVTAKLFAGQRSIMEVTIPKGTKLLPGVSGEYELIAGRDNNLIVTGQRTETMVEEGVKTEVKIYKARLEKRKQ